MNDKMYIHARVKLRNGGMIEGREKKGWSQAKLAEVSGILFSVVRRYEKLERQPTEDHLCRLSIALEVEPDKLTAYLPKGTPTEIGQASFIERAALEDYAERTKQRALELSGVRDQSPTELMRANIDTALDSLTERERKVIGLRYGLHGQRAHTIEETGRVIKVTRERARQVEAKALRKLQHPARAKLIDPDWTWEG